jgi:hypothetical protein
VVSHISRKTSEIWGTLSFVAGTDLEMISRARHKKLLTRI